jgi:hypothetical protein
LALQKDGLGRITGVDGLNKFGLFPASLTVHAGGATFSGSLDGAFTGNVGSYSQGVLNLSITPAGENPFEIPFYINASRTIMVTVSVDEEFGGNELIVFMRKPTSMATTDVAGHWRTKMMQTPDVLTLVKSNGIVTEINGRHNFEVLSEKLTVGTDGYLTGEFAEGPTLGNFNLPIPANGGATVTLNFPGQSPDQVGIQLNATKDVAFNLEADTSSHEAVFIIRTPRVASGKEETGLLSLKGSVSMHWASESGRALYENGRPALPHHQQSDGCNVLPCAAAGVSAPPDSARRSTISLGPAVVAGRVLDCPQGPGMVCAAGADARQRPSACCQPRGRRPLARLQRMSTFPCRLRLMCAA